MTTINAPPVHQMDDEKMVKKKGRKALDADKRRDQIVRQVAPIFLARGYDGISINEIVEIVGGSKTTLYSLFGGKEGLLEAVVTFMTSEVTFGIDVSTWGTLEEQLIRIGNSFVKAVLSPQVLEFHRLIVSIGRNFPAAGKLFFKSGPITAANVVAGWIEGHQTSGNLIAGDPKRLAHLYLDMLVGEHQLGWLTTYPGTAEAPRVTETVRLAARVFLGGCQRTVE